MIDLPGITRRAASDGDTGGAGRREGVLRRWFTGVVVRGDRRGRRLGYPTANIPLGDAPLRHGVYAGRALGHAAAVSVGVRPTFGHGLEPLLEAHLLDFSGDLYGRELSVELLAFLRPEERFDDIDALRVQIEEDCAAARRIERADADRRAP